MKEAFCGGIELIGYGAHPARRGAPDTAHDTKNGSAPLHPAALKNTGESMPRFDVTIAGEANVDLILYGLPDDLPPEREFLANEMIMTLGGSSAIMAHNLAALGSRVGFQSLIGGDDLGQSVLLPLKQIGVDISRVRISTGAAKTGLTAILQRAVWRNMVTYSGTIAEMTWEDLDFEYLADARHFHLSSFYLQKALRSKVPDLFRKMKEAGLTTSLDTNDDPDDMWQGGLDEALRYVDVFLPNEREAQKAAGVDGVENAIAKLAKVIPLVVVKMGGEGAIAHRGKERFASRPLNITSVDAVGAGDSFDAGFLHEYVRGSDLDRCLRAGNLAGALSTTRAGGTEAFRDAEYRNRFLKEHRSMQR